MTTTLSEGVKVPDVGSVNWAGDLEVNWNLLNGALANLSGNVKLDRDNIWTGEQSFTLPIVGSITGTASKAIADEDGTSIKTGYVNVAGNQTVSGQKTWSGNNTYTADSYFKLTNYEQGEIPSSSRGRLLYFTDKNNATIGWLQNRVEASGERSLELYVSNKFTDGQPDINGSSVYNIFKVGIKADSTRYTEIMGNTYPRNSNTYTLGTSTNQWSSVYAQTYYYNGTAWGLDQANVWSQTNRYTGFIELQYTQSGGYSDIRWCDELDATIACFRNTADNLTLGKRYTGKTAWYYGSQFSLLSNGLAVIKGYDGTNNSSVVLSGNAFYPDTSNINLGISSKKWSTINGINPGALSLISDNYVDLDRTDWMAGAANRVYINGANPTYPGWLAICMSNAASTDRVMIRLGMGPAAASFVGTMYDGSIYAVCPCSPDHVITVYFTGTITYCRYYACLGNV